MVARILDREAQALANDGIDTRAIQDGLGHVSITHTTCCTTLSQTRFKDFWRDHSSVLVPAAVDMSVISHV